MTWWFGQNRTRTPLFTEPSIPIRSTKPEISSCWAALPKAHRAPHLIEARHFNVPQQVRVDPVAFSRQAQFRLRIHGRNAHHFHKPCDPLPIHLETPCCQPRHHSPTPVKRSPRVLFVEQPH